MSFSRLHQLPFQVEVEEQFSCDESKKSLPALKNPTKSCKRQLLLMIPAWLLLKQQFYQNSMEIKAFYNGHALLLQPAGFSKTWLITAAHNILPWWSCVVHGSCDLAKLLTTNQFVFSQMDRSTSAQFCLPFQNNVVSFFTRFLMIFFLILYD